MSFRCIPSLLPLSLLSASLLSVSLLLAACSAPADRPTAVADADAVPANASANAATPPTWNNHMQRLDEQCQDLDKLLLQTPQGDLKRAAAVAGDAAALLRLGYGPFEDKTVPNYAAMAHDAESWLLQVSLEARQAHGDLAADLFRTGRERHCSACHDAHDRAHPR